METHLRELEITRQSARLKVIFTANIKIRDSRFQAAPCGYFFISFFLLSCEFFILLTLMYSTALMYSLCLTRLLISFLYLPKKSQFIIILICLADFLDCLILM